MKSFIYSLILLALTTLPAHAAETLSALPEGLTALHLSVTERTEIEQDLLEAQLRFEAEGETPQDVQEAINKAIKDALSRAEAVDAVEVSTGSYYVHRNRHDNYPVPKNGNKKPEDRPAWRGNQSLTLKSEQADTLLPLAGKLQENGFAMDNLQYTLAPEKADSARDELMASALKRLQKQAQQAASVLGKNKVELKDITIGDQNNGSPRPMMRAMHMESASATPPSAAPGTTEVTLTVSATAILSP